MPFLESARAGPNSGKKSNCDREREITARKLYLGVPVALPKSIARALYNSSFTPLYMNCKECNGKRRTQLGKCPVCDGRGVIWIGGKDGEPGEEDHASVFTILKRHELAEQESATSDFELAKRLLAE